MGWNGGPNTGLTPDQVARRAGGRQRYHMPRREVAAQRRLQLAHLYTTRIPERKLAALLGVSHSVIHTDLQAVWMAWAQQPKDDTELLALSRAIPPRRKWHQPFGPDEDLWWLVEEAKHLGLSTKTLCKRLLDAHVAQLWEAVARKAQERTPPPQPQPSWDQTF